jgi:hypothetical protein
LKANEVIDIGSGVASGAVRIELDFWIERFGGGVKWNIGLDATVVGV